MGYSRGTHGVPMWVGRAPPSSSKSASCRAGCMDGAAAGTAAQSGAHRSVVGLVRRYWVLTGYSRGTHAILHQSDTCATASWCGRATQCRAEHCTIRCIGLCGVSTGTHKVLTASLVLRRVPQCKRNALVRAPRALRPFVIGLCYALRFWRARSADARSDGYARADQRRRHQPAHARTHVRADARAELRRPDG
jgi:hypothetical protein